MKYTEPAMTKMAVRTQTYYRARARMLLLAAAIGGATLVAACGTPNSQALGGASSPGDGLGSARVITIQASEFAFSDSTIHVTSGTPVRLMLENVGAIEHDLRVIRLPASGVRIGGDSHGHANEVAAHAAAGGQAWVEFTPTKKGTYAVECTLAGHKEAGMKGTLVVE